MIHSLVWSNFGSYLRIYPRNDEGGLDFGRTNLMVNVSFLFIIGSFFFNCCEYEGSTGYKGIFLRAGISKNQLVEYLLLLFGLWDFQGELTHSFRCHFVHVSHMFSLDMKVSARYSSLSNTYIP